jgi:hypothetical protein
MAVAGVPLENDVAMVIEGTIAPIKEKRDALVTQEDELKAKLAEIQGGIRTLDRILNAAQPKETAAKPTRKTETRFSQEVLDETLAKLKEEFGAEPFTVALAVEKTGFKKARVYPATKVLREQKLLLKVGVDKENRNATLYKVAPEGS